MHESLHFEMIDSISLSLTLPTTATLTNLFGKNSHEIQ